MTQTANPVNSLTAEQQRLVQRLTASLALGQALWLSGYFAGLNAALQPSLTQPAPSDAAVPRVLTVLYGTETGNAAGLADNLVAAAKSRGLICKLVDMADYKVRQLSQEQDLLIIVSTYGEGDPPQPATGFFEFVESRKAPKLEGIRFAVLALGDSTYEYYCQAGKRLDQRFEELGARRLAPRVDCDVDFEEPAEAWIASIIGQLANDAPPVPASVGPAILGVRAATPAVHDKRNPFPAPIEGIAWMVRQTTLRKNSQRTSRQRGYRAPD